MNNNNNNNINYMSTGYVYMSVLISILLTQTCTELSTPRFNVPFNWINTVYQGLVCVSICKNGKSLFIVLHCLFQLLKICDTEIDYKII